MPRYKIEALWDCSFCKTKGIRGSIRNCPNCGNPKDEEVKFYLPDKLDFEKMLLEDTSISSEPDWLCAFCGRYNHNHLLNCESCGANKEASIKTYLDIQKEKYKNSKA